MKKISRIGIDISRAVFQLHAVTLEGELVWRKRLYSSELCDVIILGKALALGTLDSSPATKKIAYLSIIT